jgi:hypothetical protein
MATAVGPDRDPSEYSMTKGGPFFHVLRRLKIVSETGKSHYWLLAFVIWLPIAIAEGVRQLLGMPLDPTLMDLSVHARVLVSMPLFLYAERLLERSVGSAVRSMYNGDFCEPSRIDRILDRAERLRDSWLAELALLILALIGGQLALWRVVGSAGLISGSEQVSAWSFPRVWYALVALPFVQFVMFRWLWRWLIWAWMLLRLSLQPLKLIATHPDFACGLAALARPMSAFSGFALGTGVLLAAAWGTQVLRGNATIQSLLPMLTAFLVIAIVIAIMPLTPLSKHLFRARRVTLAQYGDFARRYNLEFHDKWIVPAAAAKKALGSPDIQSLNDLAESYQIAAKTRFFVFGPRHVLAVWAAGLAPMVPVFASALTVEQVLRRILMTVLGGFPF